MPPKAPTNIRCSFCGKSRGQVQKLIAGVGNTYICDECIELCNEILDEEFQKVFTACCFQGARDVHCSEEMIAVCPGDAITADGIDRNKCSAYCRTLNETTPVPEVCGKCFRFK